MAVPAQYQPGGEKGPAVEEGKPVTSSQDALSALEAQVSSPRAHAAIKTLRSELEMGGGVRSAKPGSTTDAKQQALQRLKG